MTKYFEKAKDLLTEHGVNVQDLLEGNTTTLGGRQVRLLEICGQLEVGEVAGTFDRWANSTDYYIEVWQAKGVRELDRWLRAL